MLHTLRLQNFRGYPDRTFDFGPQATIISGSNGSGKTTILEAIHMVVTGPSFRGDDQLVISHEAPWARIDMSCDAGLYSLKINRDPKRKVLSHNEQPVRGSKLSSLLFEPEQLRVLHGPPDLRRRWIDELITTQSPTYGTTLRGYARALRQRNHLLRRGQFHKDDLFVWDVKLAEYGAQIASRRREQITFINERLSDEYGRLSGQDDIVTISYETPFDHDYASQLLRALGERLYSDTRSGFTSRGPHREDIVILLGGKPVADVASRGERRTIYLATKLIELQQLHAISSPDQPPLLLLDDVFAEFDETHKELIASLDLAGQVIITTVESRKKTFKNHTHAIHINI
jgi:DNA replication and repair protein RecF